VTTTFAIDKSLGGVRARELAETYGTPLFVVDLDEPDLDPRLFCRRGAPLDRTATVFDSSLHRSPFDYGSSGTASADSPSDNHLECR